jgi:glutamyl-tRNA reductase
MNLQVVYCTHQTASLSVRERLAFSSPDHLSDAYNALKERFPQCEFVIISTCNRVEIYTAHDVPGSGPDLRQIAQFLSEYHDVPLDDFYSELSEKSGTDAVKHLFDVASSIDSMVLGESQIVNQVKSAYDAAARATACGLLTNTLFQRALTVSGRVRTETRLSEGRISIASVAVIDFGKSIFDSFADKTVLVIGAGEMGEETLRYLKSEGVKRILVCNRNPDRALRLAHEFGGIARDWATLDDCLAEADVIVSTTGADRPIIDVPRFKAVRKKTGDRPVFILDVAAPRDFDPAVGKIDDNVFLYDIDDLEATCQRNRKNRAHEIEVALKIIEEETARFVHDLNHKSTGPIIKQLREHWQDISRQELDQLFRKSPNLAEPDRQAIERTVDRIVNKLLHPPLEVLRDESRDGTPHGLLDAIRRLFRISG